MRWKRISDDTTVIFKMADDDKSSCTIHNLTNLPNSTINDVIRRRILDTMEQRKVKFGLRKKSNRLQDRILISAVKINLFTTLSEYINSSGIGLCREIIRKRLNESSLKLKKAITNVLSNQQKQIHVVR